MAFMVQSITEKHMTFIAHNREFYVALPLYYLIARTYSASENCLNPAFGLTFQLIYCISKNSFEPMKMSYIVIVGPVLGALLAVVVFEFVLRPLYPVKP